MSEEFVNRRRERRMKEDEQQNTQETKEEKVEVIEGEIMNDYFNVDERRKNKAIKGAAVSTFTVIVTVAYVLLGVFLKLWHPGWLIFLSIPIFSSLVWAIVSKKPSYFSIETLAIAAYVSVGIILPNNTGWHPYWAILLVIPVYRSIISAITKIKYVKEQE